MEPNLESKIEPDKAGQSGYLNEAINPYPVYLYPNFLNPEVYKTLRKEVKQIILLKKNSDMFQFFQSQDIGQFNEKNGPILNKFISMMKTKCRKHLQERLDIELDEDAPFDITVSRYDTYNYLLCHNDHNPDPERKHRRAMAFIYYLTSGGQMESKHGGALALYSCDKLKQPREIRQKIYPTENMLLVFPTSDLSWHSVDEVLSFQHERLSINGWFNSSKLPKLPTPIPSQMEPCPYKFYRNLSHLTPKDVLAIEQIVNKYYLNDKYISQGKERFERDGMLKLVDFLNKPVFDSMASDLSRCVLESSSNKCLIGPANKRNYFVIRPQALSPLTILIHRFFRSNQFLSILQRYTGYNFIDDDNVSLPSEYNSQKNDYKDTDGLVRQLSERKRLSEGGDHVDDKDDLLQQNVSRMPELEENNPIEILEDDHDLKFLSDVINQKHSQEENPSSSASIKRLKTDPYQERSLIRLEYHHYTPGSYTIMNDEAFDLFEANVLDLTLPFNSKMYHHDNYGGYHSYLEREPASPNPPPESEVNELVRVLAEENSLNIVNRKNNMRFLRYITHHVPFKTKSCFQELNGVYYDRNATFPRPDLIRKEQK